MNSRRLWNLHQRHKLLKAKASRDILKYRVLEIAFPEVSKKCFPPRFERFTDLKQFKYAFNVIQNWETDALQYFIRCCLFFVSSYDSFVVAG